MHFCPNCHNMYYLKIREDESNSLNYYCRNCGHEDATLTAEAICVSETQLRRSEQKYTHMVNEYTKFDPTLPRINSIKCPNQECISNGGHGNEHGKKDYEGGVKKKTEVMAKTAEGTSKADPSQAEGTSKAEANSVAEAISTAEAISKADPSVTKKKTLTIKKTAKTLAKEAEESAKEAKKVAKEVEAITKELIAEEEEEEKEEKEKQPVKEKENNREVIYIRYDDINMKYVYLCVHCDTTWKTDNRM